MLRTALGGALLGATLGYLVLLAVYPVVLRLVDLPGDVEVPMRLAVLAYDGSAATIVVVGAVRRGHRRGRVEDRCPVPSQPVTGPCRAMDAGAGNDR